jgi:hypothetical protein
MPAWLETDEPLLTGSPTQVKTVYSGQEMTREKYVLYIADAIEPVCEFDENRSAA